MLLQGLCLELEIARLLDYMSLGLLVCRGSGGEEEDP